MANQAVQDVSFEDTAFLRDTERMRFALNAAGIGVWEVDTVTSKIIWDDRCRQLFGLFGNNVLSYEEAIQYIHPDDVAEVNAKVQAALRGENNGAYNATYRTIGAEDEKLRWVNFSGTAYFDEKHRMTRFGGVAQDVTAHWLESKAKEEGETRLALIGDTVPAMIFYLDSKQRYQSYNARFMEWFGVNEKEAIGKTVREFVGEAAYGVIEPHLAVAYSGRQERYEMLAPSRMGGERWLSIVYTPHKGSEGRVLGVIVLATDITQNKQAEAAMREREESVRNFVHHAPVAMFVFRGEQMLVDIVNEKALEMIGRTGDIIGKPLLEVVPELKGSRNYEIFGEVYRTGEPQYGNEILVPLQSDGTMVDRYFNFAYTPLRENGQIVGVMDIATEVTEQVASRQKVEAAQQTTEKQKRLYEAITNNTPDLQYIFDLSYRFTYANEALLKMWGQTKEEAFGKGLRELGYEEWHAAMHEREIDQIVETKKPVRGVVSFPHAELGKRMYDYLLVPVLNKTGEVEAVAGTTRDITEIKQAEAILEEKVKERTQALEKLNHELHRSNQNLEEFAYAASHDLKEPIRKIHFFTERLKEQLQEKITADQAQSFSRITNASLRMGTLIDDLLRYSHVNQRPHEMERVDLNETLRVVLDDLEVGIEDKGVGIKVDHLPVVHGYGRQLQQLFQNLLGNAIKYSKADVPPAIHVSAANLAREGQAFHLVAVTDSGIGFNQEHAGKIFKIFTRLHGREEYSGTGVGLSIAKKIAQNHGGFIEADSQINVGSTFRVYLPVR